MTYFLKKNLLMIHWLTCTNYYRCVYFWIYVYNLTLFLQKYINILFNKLKKMHLKYYFRAFVNKKIDYQSIIAKINVQRGEHWGIQFMVGMIN